MTAAIARAVMRLARHCLGAGRGDWGAAMQAEFEEAARHGRPLAFAIGCLVAAWREMGVREDGRAVLTNYAIAIGLLFPMAALQLGKSLGLPGPFAGVADSMLAAQVGGNPYLVSVEENASSIVLLLWLLLAVAHIALAWALVAQDWQRIVRSGAVIAATTITLTLFAGVVMLDLTALVPQVAGLAIECLAIGLVARRHVRAIGLFPDPIAE